MNLKQQLTTITTASQQKYAGQSTSNGQSTRDQIKAEIENIMASDCLYCGQYMINSIDQPFIEDWDKEDDEWQ